MVSMESISKELFSVDEIDTSRNFVALGLEVNNLNIGFHSGLIICYEEEVYYFHFTGEEVLMDCLTNDLDSRSNLFFKRLDIVVEMDVVTFYGHCLELQKKGVKPNYGFVFDGSYYDIKTKDYFLVNAKHDITTCVGFCIKVIRGFLIKNPEYIKVEDWSSLDLSTIRQNILDHINYYLEKYAIENHLSVKELYDKKDLKRILPTELLCSGFYIDLPIRKAQIDLIVDLVSDQLKKGRAA
ncbi:MAG: hypothetical protein ACJASM_002873 [Salibacteraceae bacterium]|jgi:hypothetical protein